MSDSQASGGLKIMYIVWTWLLVLTIAEVLLAYFHVPLNIMLTLLMGMSVLKAMMIMSWFMHLRFERRSLVLTLVPAMVVCILLMNIFFPDSFRLGSLGIFR
jgi:cytochrome c oxidase subunit 4